MTYATVQTAVATLVKTVTGFSSANVTEGDYRIFTKGLRKGAVLRRGPSASQRIAITAGGQYPVRSNYVVNIEVYVPYKSSASATRSTLLAASEAILATLRTYPDLDGTAGVKWCGPGDMTEPVEGQFGDFTFWQQVITWPVTEVETVTVAA